MTLPQLVTCLILCCLALALVTDVVFGLLAWQAHRFQKTAIARHFARYLKFVWETRVVAHVLGKVPLFTRMLKARGDA